jgi:hypothetical protein
LESNILYIFNSVWLLDLQQFGRNRSRLYLFLHRACMRAYLALTILTVLLRLRAGGAGRKSPRKCSSRSSSPPSSGMSDHSSVLALSPYPLCRDLLELGRQGACRCMIDRKVGLLATLSVLCRSHLALPRCAPGHIDRSVRCRSVALLPRKRGHAR